MNVKECYEQMEGNYADVMSRLGKEERVCKYLGKFLNDPNFERLCGAFAEEDYPNSFLYVHNLKGLCSNLSIDKLGRSAGELCEDLRNGAASEKSAALLETLKRDYAQTKAALQKLAAEG